MSEDNTNKMIKQIFDEIIKNRKELKSTIEASEVRVLLKLEAINNKVLHLERENQEFKDKIEHLETQNKKNNIIIFGLKAPQRNLTSAYICQELKTLLNIQLEETDINNIYQLGKSADSPIKVEFVRYLKKRLVLQNCGKLKGTNLTISHDLTYNQRQEHKLLKKHLNKAKEKPKTTSVT